MLSTTLLNPLHVVATKHVLTRAWNKGITIASEKLTIHMHLQLQSNINNYIHSNPVIKILPAARTDLINEVVDGVGCTSGVGKVLDVG